MEGLDDAEDGAEQTDERRVRAEGAEQVRAAIELFACCAELALDGIGHRRRTAALPGERRREDARLDRGARVERLLRSHEVARGERAGETRPQRGNVITVTTEEEPALEHRGERQHREGKQEPEHPRAPGERHLQTIDRRA